MRGRDALRNKFSQQYVTAWSEDLSNMRIIYKEILKKYWYFKRCNIWIFDTEINGNYLKSLPDVFHTRKPSDTHK